MISTNQSVGTPNKFDERLEVEPRGTDTTTTIRPPKSPFLAPTSAAGGAENRFRANAEFVERPRQLVVLTAVVGAVALGAFLSSWGEACADEGSRFRLTVAVMSFCFLVHCFLQCRDTLLVRPHPGVWRVVHGLGMLYLLFLAFLLCQDRADALRYVRLLAPDVARLEAQAEASALHTAQDCGFSVPRLVEEFTEVWFYAHVLGWWGKMCIFRNWTLCMILSIGFEVLELSLTWLIPQFNECWWDSLISDAVIANMSGMYAGHLTLRFLETHQFNWGGYQPRLQRALGRFYPLSWSRWEWEALGSFKRFTQVLVLVLLTLAAELNAFMFLNAMDVPKESRLNAARLLLVAAVGVPAAHEYYEYVTNPVSGRLGQNMWVFFGMIQLEWMMWAKFANQSFMDHMEAPPVDITCIWVLSLGLFATWALLFFSLSKPDPAECPSSPSSLSSQTPSNPHRQPTGGPQVDIQQSQKKVKVWRYILVDIVLVAAIAPLFYLAKQYHY